jgi:hypothetical protein
MKLITKLATAGLLVTGIPLTLTAFATLLFDSKNRSGSFSVFVFFGVFTAFGLWLVRGDHKLKKEREENHLREVLFTLLKKQQGRVSILDFAVTASIPTEKARIYLEEQHKIIGGNIDIDISGSLYYQFPLS